MDIATIATLLANLLLPNAGDSHRYLDCYRGCTADDFASYAACVRWCEDGLFVEDCVGALDKELANMDKADVKRSL